MPHSRGCAATASCGLMVSAEEVVVPDRAPPPGEALEGRALELAPVEVELGAGALGGLCPLLGDLPLHQGGGLAPDALVMAGKAAEVGSLSMTP